MALTLNNFMGFETGGLEEVTVGIGTPVAVTSPVRSGTYSLEVQVGDAATVSPFEVVSDAGNDYIAGFAVRMTDVLPSTAVNFFAFREGNNKVCYLKLTAVNVLQLFNEADAAVASFAGAFKVDTWHYIEVRFNHSATGAAKVWVDGTERLASTPTSDFSGGSTLDQIRLENPLGAGTTIYFDDLYVLSGSTAETDRLGDAEVFKYQSAKASATPDDGGDDLDAGNWADAGETPLNESNEADYTSTAAGAVDTDATNGSPEGPKNDSRIHGDSNIKGMKGVWRMGRGAGGGTAHYGLLGNDGDGTARTADFDPSVAFDNFFHLTEASGGAAGDIPLSTEYCRIGFEIDGAQDFDCADMWAMLLHVPASITELGIKPPMWNSINRHMLVR